MPATAQLVVLSGPSGVGKSTVLRKLVECYPDQLRLSVSATTRPPRPGETDSVDYYFLESDEFQRRREAGEFLECFEVFGRGHWYGTLLSEVRPSPDDPRSVILDVDVAGADQVRRLFSDVPTIFLQPGSEQELQRRLRARGTETEAAIQRRLEVARRELDRADEYQFQVVNDTVDDAVNQISEILRTRGIVK
jgi:guanylate kinase